MKKPVIFYLSITWHLNKYHSHFFLMRYAGGEGRSLVVKGDKSTKVFRFHEEIADSEDTC